VSFSQATRSARASALNIASIFVVRVRAVQHFNMDVRFNVLGKRQEKMF